MTTYMYKLVFGDSDMIALTAALDMYEKFCTEQLANGPKAPYWAHNESLKRIKSRLFDDTTQLSGIF